MSGKAETFPPVTDLWAESVDVKPVDADWSEGYPERWEYFEAVKCEGEGQHIHLSTEGIDKCDVEGCGEYVPTAEGPMMNYYYPIPQSSRDFDAEEAARKLVDLPLCVVRFEGTGAHALALTGGGMDLSESICEAYMRLGFLPPFHYAANLPATSDELTPTREWVLEGCRRSALVMEARASRAKEHLAHVGSEWRVNRAEGQHRREAAAKKGVKA